MKKNGDANNNPILIIVLPIIFILSGCMCLLLTLKSFDALVLLIGCILLLAGIALFIFGIKRSKMLKAYKSILNNPNSHITEATFIKATISSFTSKTVGVNGRSLPTSINVYKKIKYSYTDENGVQQIGKSVLSYTSNQVKFLQNKGKFRIKCCGKISVIIEEIPEQNANFNL